VLGFDSSEVEVQCSDHVPCPLGSECVNYQCMCVQDCELGGSTGKKGMGAAGGTANTDEAGGQAGQTGSGGPAAGGSGPAQGGTSGQGARGGANQGGQSHGAGVAGSSQPAGQSGEAMGGGGVENLAGAGAGGAGEAGEAPGPPPPSCNSLLPCSGVSCCTAFTIPAGSFDRSCDPDCQETCDFPARLSEFALDEFEVTVGRFRQFVQQYPVSIPKAGSGANPNNPADTGWDADWSNGGANNMLLTAPADLEAALLACDVTESTDEPPNPMWTEQPGANEQRPINCVTWYEAQAFCIWDGGRLPTEAEWNYAAAGGTLDRVYPWSDPPGDDSIDPTLAVYGATSVDDIPAVVGTHPDGHGLWGQQDLAGNVAEWVWDGFQNCYAVPDCSDCGVTEGLRDKGSRGGSYRSTSDRVSVDARGSIDGGSRSTNYGFRCARPHWIASSP
jgi:formylglycine-generating enzyme